MDSKKTAIRYTREQLLALNNNTNSKLPKVFEEYKNCFNYSKEKRGIWNPLKFWEIKQAEKNNRNYNWKLHNAASTTASKSNNNKWSKTNTGQKQERQQAADDSKSRANKTKLLVEYEQKKREFLELAEKAAFLSKELLDIHKNLSIDNQEHEKNQSIVEDLNTSSFSSSGYGSMESSMSKSFHASSPVVLTTQVKATKIAKQESPKLPPAAPIADKTQMIEQMKLIEHVRKVYQNALIRSQLNKTNEAATRNLVKAK